MFGAGIASGGDLYVAMLGYCLLLSICLKLCAVFANSRGWQNWTIPKLRLLWPFTTLAVLLLLIILFIGLTWMEPPLILGQIASLSILVCGVGAVFFFIVTERGKRGDVKWPTLAAMAGLSLISMMASGALIVLYFVAKYTFLIALIALTIYSSRMR
jgi:hypothetical protein